MGKWRDRGCRGTRHPIHSPSSLYPLQGPMPSNAASPRGGAGTEMRRGGARSGGFETHAPYPPSSSGPVPWTRRRTRARWNGCVECRPAPASRSDGNGRCRSRAVPTRRAGSSGRAPRMTAQGRDAHARSSRTRPAFSAVIPGLDAAIHATRRRAATPDVQNAPHTDAPPKPLRRKGSGRANARGGGASGRTPARAPPDPASRRRARRPPRPSPRAGGPSPAPCPAPRPIGRRTRCRRARPPRTPGARRAR